MCVCVHGPDGTPQWSKICTPECRRSFLYGCSCSTWVKEAEVAAESEMEAGSTLAAPMPETMRHDAAQTGGVEGGGAPHNEPPPSPPPTPPGHAASRNKGRSGQGGYASGKQNCCVIL